ncbi:MAG TPA: lysylphosphatidylglycerol synthase transmembrane domain-containing protein [Gaiellaceae bacterium]|nr:lysylphosphatidylglycerol synthase transmembrane domain-containing protein [Gaiellaceae bacterium]
MKRAAWIVVSVVSLGAVVWWATRQQAPKMPTDAAGAAWLAASLGAYALALVLRGWRWHRILRLARVPHKRADAFWLMCVAYMGNTVLPLRGGELLRISLLSSRTTARAREVLGTVIAERVLDVATLAVVFAVLTFGGVDGAPTGKIAAYVAVGLVIAAAAGLFGYLALRRRGRFDAFADRIRPYAHGSRIFAHAEGVTLAGMSGLIWLLEGTTVMLVGRSLGIHLGLLAALLTNVIASLFSALPAGPGYAGSYDAGILLGLHAATVYGGTAVGFLLLVRAVVFVPVTIVGLIVLVARYGGLRRNRAALAVET